VDKLVIVGVREFVETVKTRAFLITAVIMPGVIIGLIFGARQLMEMVSDEPAPVRKILVLDGTQAVFQELRIQVDKYNEENPKRLFELVAAHPADTDAATFAPDVERGDYYAYLAIPADILEGDPACALGRNDAQVEAGRRLERMINNAVVAVRCRANDPPIEAETLERLRRKVQVAFIDVKTGAASAAGDEMARVITPFAFVFLLYMATMGISAGLLTSVIEEKNSRVAEVLLSAVSPTQLMAGKILGMACVGLLLICIWSSVGYASANARGMAHLLPVYQLGYALLYFLPGFLLVAAALAGVGAACNTLKEAQGMAYPLSLVTIVPILLWWQISQYPNSALAIGLSFVPPITPLVMILRICADPDTPVWQIVATLAVLWAAVVGMIWAAGKIFRVGLLMYGKPPSVVELFRWLRYA
jgi:ABC-2 type transport system permease protein